MQVIGWQMGLKRLIGAKKGSLAIGVQRKIELYPLGKKSLPHLVTNPRRHDEHTNNIEFQMKNKDFKLLSTHSFKNKNNLKKKSV